MHVVPHLLLLCAVLALVRADAQILAASSLNTCFAASVGNVQLNCSQTQSTATILDLRVTYSQTDMSGQNKFVFNLATLPLSNAQTQLGTLNECNQPNAQNQCGLTQPTTIEVTMTKPILKYQMTQIPNFQVPFAYYQYAADADCLDRGSSCFTDRSGAQCQFVSSTMSRSGVDVQKVQPNVGQIIDLFKNTNGPFTGGNPIYCPRSTNPDPNNPYVSPNGNISQPGQAVLVYNFHCNGAQGKKDFDLRIFSGFYQLEPMCNVYQIEPTAETVSRLTFKISVQQEDGSFDVEEISIDTNSYEVANVTADGRLLVRVLNVQSANNYFGPKLYGLIMVCSSSVPMEGLPNVQTVPPLDMVGDNDPLVNPWTRLEPAELQSYIMPTPQILNLLRTPLPGAEDQFFLFYNPTQSFAVGRQCAKLGVNPNLYSEAPTALYFDNYLLNFNKANIRFTYDQIINGLSQVPTCVPGAGQAFQDIDVPIPCEAIEYMVDANEGDGPTRKARYDQEVLGDPQKWRKYTVPMTNPAMQNVYIRNNELYVQFGIDAALEATISARGDFVGVLPGATVTDGFIDTGASTGCTLIPESYSATLAVRVCSGVPIDSLQLVSYLAYVSCPPPVLTVPPGRAQKQTDLLGYNQCQTLQFMLTYNPLEVATPQCTVQLSSTQATISFNPNSSLILDQAVVLCDTTALSSNVSVVTDLVPLPNGSILSTNLATIKIKDNTYTHKIWILLAIIFGAVIALIFVVAMCGIIYCRRRADPEVVTK